jgi:hypothetical protein
MTNEEIWKAQREHRMHMALMPVAIANVKARLIDFDERPIADNEAPRDGILCGELRVLLKEIERLQAAVKRANDDLRDEQREGQRAASSAYSEGRHDGLSESRDY